MPVDDTVDIDPAPSGLDAIADAINSGGAPTPDAPDDAPTADAPSDAEGPEAAAAPEPAPDPEPDPIEPFAFNAFKQRYEVPGLTFNPRTGTIQAESPQALERVKQLLSRGREWEAEGRYELKKLQAANHQLKAQPHEEIEKARVYLDEWNTLMQMSEEQLFQFLTTARGEWPKIEARAERAYAEKLYQQAQAAQQPPEPDVEQVVEHASHGAAELVQEFLHDQPWATPEMAASLTQFLNERRNMDHWVARATRDIPEQGLRKGQYVALWDDARQMLIDRTQPYRDAHAQYATRQTAAAQQIQKTQTVAHQNAKALALVKGTKPASVAPRPPTSSPPPTRETRQDIIAEAFGTWREMKRAR